MQTTTLADLQLTHKNLSQAHSEFIDSMYAKYDDKIDDLEADLEMGEEWEWDEVMTADEYTQHCHMKWATADAYKAMYEAEYPPPTEFDKAIDSVLHASVYIVIWGLIAFVLFASNSHL